MKRAASDFSLTLDGKTYKIVVDGNSVLVDGQPFVVGFDGDQVLVDGTAFDASLDAGGAQAVVGGIVYDLEVKGLGPKQLPALRPAKGRS
jgi:hypothetical protein